MKYLYAFFGILIIFLIIYGLRSPLQPNYSPDDVKLREKRQLYEQFANPKESSDLEVQQGASNFYDWRSRDLRLSDETYDNYKRCDEGDTQCEMKVKNVNVQNDYYIINKKEADCNKCAIDKHPDLDKYVLKTSVPPCPDISKFALKTDIAAPNMPDMNNYILKTDIPVCEKCPDISNYVLKTNIPANVDCPKCPTCPVCPVCPVCPPTFKNIEDDPKFKKYMANFVRDFDLNKYPQFKDKVITKKDCDARLKKQKDEIYQQIINNSDTIVRDIEKLKRGTTSQSGTSQSGTSQSGTSSAGTSQSGTKNEEGNMINRVGDSLKSRAGKLWNIITNSGVTEQMPNYESVGSGDKSGPYCDKMQGYNC
jgi:hypothetical protein